MRSFRASSKVARDAVAFPVAVARRLGAFRAVRLLWRGLLVLLPGRAARLRFGECAFGFGREFAGFGHAAKGPANRWPVKPLWVRRCVLSRPLEGRAR